MNYLLNGLVFSIFFIKRLDALIKKEGVNWHEFYKVATVKILLILTFYWLIEIYLAEYLSSYLACAITVCVIQIFIFSWKYYETFCLE
jgi:hypothetical protein